MSSESQFSLLHERRFLPFFITQFMGAFNDNVFKNALIILIAFQGANMAADDSRYLVNISAALFILPFFLFSSTAGQIGDSYEKSWLMRRIKLAEVVIMLIAAAGFFKRLFVVANDGVVPHGNTVSGIWSGEVWISSATS